MISVVLNVMALRWLVMITIFGASGCAAPTETLDVAEPVESYQVTPTSELLVDAALPTTTRPNDQAAPTTIPEIDVIETPTTDAANPASNLEAVLLNEEDFSTVFGQKGWQYSRVSSSDGKPFDPDEETCRQIRSSNVTGSAFDSEFVDEASGQLTQVFEMVSADGSSSDWIDLFREMPNCPDSTGMSVLPELTITGATETLVLAGEIEWDSFAPFLTLVLVDVDGILIMVGAESDDGPLTDEMIEIAQLAVDKL